MSRKRKSSGRRSLNTLDAEEYRTDEEILGFKPLDVIDELINSVHDSVCDIIDETEQRVSAKFPAENTVSIQQGFDVFLDMWGPVLDKYCDKFELFALKNSFKISPSLRRLIDQHNGNQPTEDTQEEASERHQQQKDLDNEIQQLQQQLYEEKCKNQFMSLHLQQLEQQLPSNLAEISQFLDEFPLPTSQLVPAMESLVTHHQELEQLITTLKQEVKSLPQLDEPDGDIESKFLAHSNQIEIQSVDALQSITDAMDDS